MSDLLSSQYQSAISLYECSNHSALQSLLTPSLQDTLSLDPSPLRNDLLILLVQSYTFQSKFSDALGLLASLKLQSKDNSVERAKLCYFSGLVYI